jgi:hypothetical protein
VPDFLLGDSLTDGYLTKSNSGGDIVNSVLKEIGTMLGLNCSPSAWESSYPGIQATGGSPLVLCGAGAWLLNNIYRDSGYTFKHIATGVAAMLLLDTGSVPLDFQIAPSASAGTAASLTSVLSINASGDLTSSGTAAYVETTKRVACGGGTTAAFSGASVLTCTVEINGVERTVMCTA